MDEFINEFIVETQEGLTTLDTALVTLSEQPDDKALLDKIFRILHTIKGTCGFLGLSRLEKVAHIAETFLDKFRKGERVASPDDVGLILNAMDHIRFLVDAIAAQGAEPDGDDSALIASIQAAIDGTGAPPAEDGEPKNIPATIEQTPPAPSAPGSGGGDQSSQFLRVHVDTLEEMLAMVSELVLTRNQMGQIIRAQTNDVLESSLQRLDGAVTDLQDVVMKARMQPIGGAWAKFPRIIHDISRETGKSIKLNMHGEDTEIDRQVLEFIKDPLLHMVRNSADHGIESPADRRAAGKNETGTVSLSARHERGYIVIEIRDDGKGLSPDKIRQTALARGVATEEQLAAQSDKQVLSYIFAPGFSTAEKVTAISGRGVGMDVVRTNIEKIGGTIDLESVLGQWSCFTIRIPLTLAIISALLVETGAQRYAVPQLAVQELIRIGQDTAEKIEMAGGFPVLRLREYLLPLVNLGGFLDGGDPTRVPETCHIVIVHAGATRFGMIVDAVPGTEEIVVKPLPTALRDLTIFAGNTILGDGRVIMILDPAGIAAQAHISGRDMGSAASGMDSALNVADTDDHTALLIFRAQDSTPKAVPAFLVTRIVEFARSDLEKSGDQSVVQYQGRLMEMHKLGDEIPEGDIIKTLIFSDEGTQKIFGVMIDAVEDIISTNVEIEETGRRPGYLGSAIINGRTTDILDINHFTGEDDWLPADVSVSNMRSHERRRVLLVDDSAFFRHMLQPLLNLAGYTVTVAPGPISALALCDRGMDFDMIVSDIEMEEMDGLTFAEKVKGETRWKDIPMVALSSHATPQDKEKGYNKGFSAYVSKADRDALLTTLRDVFERSRTGDAKP